MVSKSDAGGRCDRTPAQPAKAPKNTHTRNTAIASPQTRQTDIDDALLRAVQGREGVPQTAIGLLRNGL
jgi:hypothetical protein